jgi:hypothetical protein
MKRFTRREIKRLITQFEELKNSEKEFNIRAHYSDIVYHLRCLNCFVNGARYFSIKEEIAKGII